MNESIDARSDVTAFSIDYFSARQRFRETAAAANWGQECVPITAKGPDDEELTIDAAWLTNGQPEAMLVLSSGLHGTEALFGSAVQVKVLEELGQDWPVDRVGLLLLHSLNPYGFAWIRRCDANNVDLNRNFLLPGEAYEGCPEMYAKLDPLLNPKKPPSWWDSFTLKASLAIVRYGFRAIKQAIAGGQYEFPKGLFYGGAEPSELTQLLQAHLGRWLRGASRVLHLDFHTGLGRWSTFKLLIDNSISEKRYQWLAKYFDPKTLELNAAQQTAYVTRGSLGRWCTATFPDKEYTYLCAEFGTYSPLKVIGALRSENQAHHWGEPDARSTGRAKRHVQEMLVPASPGWRDVVILSALDLVRGARNALSC